MAYKKKKLASIPENITLQLTEKETEPELDPARINETKNNFQQIITSAADKSFGILRLQKIRKRPVPWWNEESLSIEQKNIPQTKT